LGIRVNTLRNQELGRREPEGLAHVLLLAAALQPGAVLEPVEQRGSGSPE